MAKRVDNPATTIINFKVARLDNFVLNTANIAYAVTANAGTMLRGNTDLVFTPEVPVPPAISGPPAIEEKLRVQNRYGRALICGGLAVLFLGVMVLIARESADLKLRLFDGLIWAFGVAVGATFTILAGQSVPTSGPGED
jgi:hypothetical protein